MKSRRKRRVYAVASIVIGVGIAIGLSLFALSQDVDLYLTPSQVLQHHFHSKQSFRLGGRVKEGSFYRKPGTLHVRFVLSDNHHGIEVNYKGILPVLFQTGQSIVVQGYLNHHGIFISTQVLAKHDATYRPRT